MRISRFSVLLIILMTCAAGLIACGGANEDTNNSSTEANNSSDSGTPDSGTPDSDTPDSDTPDSDTGPSPECDADTAELLDDDVNGEDVTLSQCTLVTKRVAIGGGGSVTVVPGSTLLFEQRAGFWITSDGALNAAGTSDEPILFTATDKQAGYWQGLYYENSGSSDNVFEHVTMEYTGAENRPGLHTRGETTITVRNSTVRHSSTAGFEFDAGISSEPNIIAFENNTITENALAGVSTPMAAAAIDTSNDLSGNTVDRLEIRPIGAGAKVSSSTTYQNIGIPYLFRATFQVHNGATWTVESGVEILMEGGESIKIAHDGIFVVEGTSEAPITIRGKEAVAGYWESFDIAKSSSPSNLLAHVLIQDAGSGGSESSAAIRITSGTDVTTRMTFDQVTIRDSGNHGVFSNDGFEGAIEVSGCDTVTFEGIAGDEFVGDPICI